MTDLGAVLERYETSNRRRAVAGMLAVTAGIPVTVLGVWSHVILYSGPADGGSFLAAIILGSGLAMIVMGGYIAVASMMRKGEHFTVHERGFVHSWGAKTIVVPWTDIAIVTDISKKAALAKAFGGDIICQIVLNGGRKVIINAYTEGAPLLIRRIVEATSRPAQAE